MARATPTNKILGYSQITGIAAAKAITAASPAPPANARVAMIQAEGATVRFRGDGTNPTATVGWRLNQNSDIAYDGDDLLSLKFIEEVPTGVVNIIWFT